MDTVELFQRLSVALAIGLLIGLERGWQAREDREGERSAGLRTHALASLLGAVWGAISNQTGIGGAVALGIAFFIFSAAIILFRYRETSHDGTFGATTVMAAMLAFALGALAVVGDMQAAIAAGVAATGLLALKSSLHGWMRRLTWPELR
ncbi:MAG: MgtC/SapB family protein, partial [Methylocystis sp.]